MGVLIIRTTIFVPDHIQKQVRYGLMFFLGITLAFDTHSSINRTTFIDASNRCVSIYLKSSNLTGVIMSVLLYLTLFGIFIVPAVKYYKSMEGVSQDMLGDVMFSVSFRVAIAMGGYVISAIFAILGIWGDQFYIEFSLENYCAITASTYAIKKDGSASAQMTSSKDTKSRGLESGVSKI